MPQQKFILFRKMNINYENFKEVLEVNAKEAEEIKEYINQTDKNLYNTQEVIDWQDRLNAVSITNVDELS